MSIVKLYKNMGGGDPLDVLLAYCELNQWPARRLQPDLMVADVAGEWGTYEVFYIWEHMPGSLQIFCRIDLVIHDAVRPAIKELLLLINEKLWLGHFDIASEDNRPLFRHNILLRGSHEGSLEQIADATSILLDQCNRYFPAFYAVAKDGKDPASAFAVCLLEPTGRV